MLPFHLVYHPGYDLNLGEHVFPSRKYRLIHDRLLREGIAVEDDFIEPAAAADEDILLVHERGWMERLKAGTLSEVEILKLEIPYSRQMVEAVWLAVGGTILAARNALADGAGFNLGGGFHHAFPEHGEGFCALHDVAIAIRRLQQDGAIRRAMVVDCDVHHGNGTAKIFTGDSSVLTLSIHQFNNYPAEKPPSVIDLHLANRVGDEEYLDRLRGALPVAMDGFQPDLVMYIAGADPYRKDRLGGLDLTIAGLRERDRLVMKSICERNAAVAVTLAGGYAQNVDDTVAIHCNTVRAAAEVFR